MKNAEDFKRAIGIADNAFVSSVRQTLTELQNEEEKPVKRFSVSFALVMAILLIAAVAFAAATQWGVLDFVNNRSGEGKVSPEAAELIQQNVAQQGGQTNLAAFSLREAIFDGKQLYMVIAVKPADESTLLLGTDALPSDPVGNMGPLYAHHAMTIMDYAYQNGKTLLLHTNVHDSAAMYGVEGYVSSIDFILEEDGTLVYMLTGACDSQEDRISVELTCSVTPFVDIAEGDELDIDRKQQTQLSFTLESAQVKNTVTSAEPAIFADCGVRVDRVTLSSSPMSTHVQIEFSVIDKEKFALTDDGLWFEFLDENGVKIADGTTGGSISPAEGSDGTAFVQVSSLISLDPLPDKITLRGYNCWEKNRYEAHEIIMK